MHHQWSRKLPFRLKSPRKSTDRLWTISKEWYPRIKTRKITSDQCLELFQRNTTDYVLHTSRWIIDSPIRSRDQTAIKTMDSNEWTGYAEVEDYFFIRNVKATVLGDAKVLKLKVSSIRSFYHVCICIMLKRTKLHWSI